MADKGCRYHDTGMRAWMRLFNEKRKEKRIEATRGKEEKREERCREFDGMSEPYYLAHAKDLKKQAYGRVDMFSTLTLSLLETDVAGEARPEMTDDEPARGSFSCRPLELEPDV